MRQSYEEWEREVEADNVAAGRRAFLAGQDSEHNPWVARHVGDTLARVYSNRAAAWRRGYDKGAEIDHQTR